MTAPFNMSDWGGEHLRQDVRWKFGMPPVNNANYAWIQHFKATVPIYYEARLAKIDLKPEERPKIDPNFAEGASRTGIRRRGGIHEGKSAAEVSQNVTPPW